MSKLTFRVVPVNLPHGSHHPLCLRTTASSRWNQPPPHRAAPLTLLCCVKYERNTSRAKMNRIHHFDVFVRFLRPSNVLSGSRGREKVKRKREKNLKSRRGRRKRLWDAKRGHRHGESIKRHAVMVCLTLCSLTRALSHSLSHTQPKTLLSSISLTATHRRAGAGWGEPC